MHRRVRSNRSARSLAVFIRHACHSRRGRFPLENTNTEKGKRVSLSLSSETRKLLVKNLSMVRAEIIARRRLLSSIRPDRKEGLYRRKSRCQLESKREGSQVSPANLPVPRQDNGGSCLGGFRGRECLTVLTERRREREVSAWDVDRKTNFMGKNGGWSTNEPLLSVRNLRIFKKEKNSKKRYFILFFKEEILGEIVNKLI